MINSILLKVKNGLKVNIRSSLKVKFIFFLFNSIIFFQCSPHEENKMINQDIEIYINNFYGKTERIKINIEKTINDLKDIIKDRLSLKKQSQILYKNGKILNNKDTVKDKVRPYDFLNLSSKLLGGDEDYYFGFVGFDKHSNCYKEFSNIAPKWRIVYPGINFEGICKNSKCEAGKYHKRVWAILSTKRGKLITRFKGAVLGEAEELDEQFYNPFQVHVLRTRCYCPICYQKLSPNTVLRFGFVDCKFHIYGTRYNDDMEYSNMNNIINSDKGFIYFDGEKTGIQKWLHILVVVERL